jgi:hypothetical protein
MSLGFSWAISLTRGRRDLSNMLSIIIPSGRPLGSASQCLIMKERYYIGLDIHKDTVGIVINKISTSRAEATYHSTCGKEQYAGLQNR